MELQRTSTKDKFRSFLKIQHDLIPAKVLYFLFYLSLVCIWPFYPVFYGAIGLNPSQVGIMGGLRLLVTLFGAPFFGGIADKYQCHKRILLLAVCVAAVFRVGMTIVGSSSFIMLAILVSIGEFFGASVVPIIDKMVLDMLGPNRKDLYGRQRLFGTIAWGTTAPAIGAAAGHFDNINLYFYCHGIVAILFCLVVFKMDLKVQDVTLANAATTGVTIKVPFWRRIVMLLTSWRVAAFFFLIFLTGLNGGVMANFTFLHLRNLGASSTLLGLTQTVACLAELPCFFFSGPIIKRLTPNFVVCIAMIAVTLRLLVYSLLTNPNWVLPNELFHGITFGLMWASVTRIGQNLAPPGLGTTVQGMIVAIQTGMGSATGGVVGGLIFERYGAPTVFRISSGIAFLGFLFYTTISIINYAIERKQGASYAVLTEMAEHSADGQAMEDDGEDNSEDVGGVPEVAGLIEKKITIDVEEDQQTKTEGVTSP